VLGRKDVAITVDRYSHAMPTMQAEAMRRLMRSSAVADRRPGRGLRGVAEGAAQWLDEEPGAAPTRRGRRRKGPDMGAFGDRRATKTPDLRSDRA